MRGTPAATIPMPMLDFRAEVGTVDTAARTVELTFSTGAAGERYDYYSGKRYIEVLSMKPAHIRLERLNAGASLLDTHSSYSLRSVIGAVVRGSARIEKGQGICVVRFSKRDEVEPLWQDVVDGIFRFFSVGYKTHKSEEAQAATDKLPTRTAVDWEPYEVSMVPMPFDLGAQARDAGQLLVTNPCVIARTLSDADRVRRLRLALSR